MKANKITLNKEVLIDLTQDTAVEEDVATGKTFHKADGSVGVGTAELADPTWIPFIEGREDTLNIPTVTKIDNYFFYNNYNIQTITMPNVTKIGVAAFFKCERFYLFELPDKLERIEDSAFAYTRVMMHSIPASVKHIGTSAFQYCDYLTSITFKGKPATLKYGIFTSCKNLTTLNVPWAEGEVSGAPWGAANATINYNYTGE